MTGRKNDTKVRKRKPCKVIKKVKEREKVKKEERERKG